MSDQTNKTTGNSIATNYSTDSIADIVRTNADGIRPSEIV